LSGPETEPEIGESALQVYRKLDELMQDTISNKPARCAVKAFRKHGIVEAGSCIICKQCNQAAGDYNTANFSTFAISASGTGILHKTTRLML
jgi:hypothetical protein